MQQPESKEGLFSPRTPFSASAPQLTPQAMVENLRGWVGGVGVGVEVEVGQGRGAADSADWWETISPNFTCNTPGDKGLGVGEVDKKGEQQGGLRWTFLGKGGDVTREDGLV